MKECTKKKEIFEVVYINNLLTFFSSNFLLSLAISFNNMKKKSNKIAMEKNGEC